MGFFRKLMPTRQATVDKSFEVIADVDSLIEKPIGFILHGRPHQIKPITTRNFMIWSKALANLTSLKSENVQEKEVFEASFNVIASLCDSITRKDIENATQAQIAAIYGIILDHVSGKAHTGDYLKKKMKNQSMSEKSMTS